MQSSHDLVQDLLGLRQMKERSVDQGQLLSEHPWPWLPPTACRRSLKRSVRHMERRSCSRPARSTSMMLAVVTRWKPNWPYILHPPKSYHVVFPTNSETTTKALRNSKKKKLEILEISELSCVSVWQHCRSCQEEWSHCLPSLHGLGFLSMFHLISHCFIAGLFNSALFYRLLLDCDRSKRREKIAWDLLPGSAKTRGSKWWCQQAANKNLCCKLRVRIDPYPPLNQSLLTISVLSCPFHPFPLYTTLSFQHRNEMCQAWKVCWPFLRFL